MCRNAASRDPSSAPIKHGKLASYVRTAVAVAAQSKHCAWMQLRTRWQCEVFQLVGGAVGSVPARAGEVRSVGLAIDRYREGTWLIGHLRA